MNKITRYDPFSALNALQRQFFGDDGFSPMKNVSLPTTDVYTSDDNQLIVEAHLPNFDEKDVDISVENGSLIIQAEKHEKEEDKKKKYVVRESSSSFYRSVRLPERADEDKISARMHDGLLKVTMPLKALPEPKKISIEKGK